jgi:long-chain fatty acid transport protein
MRTLIWFPAVFTAVMLLCTHTARGDGVVRDGVGAISMGRGGVNLAYDDNAAIILDNPAGMISGCDCGFWEAGVDTVVCDLHYSDPDNDVNNDVKAFPSGMFGLVRRSQNSPWAWGFGVFVPAGFSAEFDMVNPHTGPTHYKSLGVLGKVLPGVAYQATDRLSIGATLGVGIGHAELEGPFYVQTGPLAGAPTLMDLQGTDAALTGGIGLQYALTESTTLGLAYTEETRFDFDGSSRATLFTPFGPLGSDFDTRIDLVWPRSVGVGLKHELCACRRLGVDVIWYDWSHAFDQLDLVFSNPSNPMVPALVPGGVLRDSLAMRWDDSVSLRLGYEWDTSDALTWRVGYVYHDSPVPDATLNPFLDGVLEHALNVGASWCCNQRATLNLAYQYSFGRERHVADSEIVGGDFDNSTFDADAHWFAASVLVPY